MVEAKVETGAERGVPGPAAELPAIELQGVVKQFPAASGGVQAVDQVDLDIAEGEFFSLLGPSGCGKTTTLRMVAGFEEPTGGRILLHGRDVIGVPPYRRDVNMVFQQYALFPHMDVFENVAFGLRRKKVAKGEIRRRVGEMLELVELTGTERRRPRQLSGGQQQRVAVARALVNHPRALLLDEPLGALDLKLRQAMQLELKRIQREVGVTFVYVTHDQGEALTMSDRLAVMHRGRVEQLGSPRELYEHPASRFVAGFIGTSNVFTGRIDREAGGLGVIELGPDERVLVPLGRVARPGAEVDVVVRPEKIALLEAGAAPADGRCRVRGRVAEVVYLGTSTTYNVTVTGGTEVTVFRQNATSDTDAQVAQGRELWLVWAPEHSYVLGQRPRAEEEDAHGTGP
jgi:spermidine/putrescine transport system ATP-binding protein